MKTIESILDNVITETVSSNKMKQVYLSEKDKQVKLSSKNDLEQAEDVEDQNDEDDEALSEVPEIDDIIEKLNLIRSGKSLKDSAVENRFEGYFNDLEDAEKVALFAFLKGMAQIINGEIDPQLAQEPEDDPANIEMMKKAETPSNDSDEKKHNGKTVQRRKVSPQVVKAHKPDDNDEEDASPPIVTIKSKNH